MSDAPSRSQQHSAGALRHLRWKVPLVLLAGCLALVLADRSPGAAWALIVVALTVAAATPRRDTRNR